MKLTTILKMISLLPQKQYSDILRHINSQIYFKSFIALICLFSLQTATAQWQENFALSSLNNEVSAVLHDDNNIYVAGHFTSDGDTQLNYIAKWNGTNWEALGDGFNATVYALTLDIEGNLIASGEFSSSGSKPLSHIAKWDGDSWEALGDGLDASASTLILDSEGNLIAGGSFFSSGSTFIAKWNGTSWEPLGEGFDGYVYALTLDNEDNLIAGGTFIADPSNSESFNSIAKWNGTSWEPLGDGFGGYVYALTLDNEGNLIAGGTFYSNFLHNQRLNYIAKWNGTEWEPISEGFNDSVYTLTLDSEGHLVAGGIFNSTSSNTERMSHVAKWNGSSWEPLGNGLDSAVYSLTLDNEGNLIAGGSFEQADNIASAYLAKWKPPIVNFELIEQSIEESSTSFDLAVQLSEASRHTISIPFSVGAASSINDDYSISASPLTINAGDTEAQLSITIDNDVISESDEKLIINMGSLTNANKGSKTQFTLTITDDDIVEVAVKEGSNELTTSTTIDLGRINIGESLSKTLTVENTGSIDLVLSSISLTGAFNFTDTVSTDLTISANSSVDLTIELSDTSIAGDYTGTLSFTTNDNDEPNFSFSLVGSVTDSNSLSDSDIDNSDNSSDSDNNTENNDDSPDENQTNSEESTGKVHIHSDRYLLGVAGHLAHIKSNPSGINCEYGEGSCTAMFDRGTNVQLELVKIKTADGFSQEDYNITWDGTDSGCAKQSVTMNNGIRCLVKVHGKQGMDYSSGNSNNAGNTTHSTTTENEPVTGQLELLNFSGHSTLNGGEEDVILGFILEGDGTTDVILHADILDAGVMPQLDLNQVIIDEQSIRGDLLKRHQHSENFILEHTVGEGIYTLQMSSLGVKGRGMAGISLKNNQLDLTNLSVRGHLKDFLVLSFIVSGEGTQKARINTRVLSGGVVTELHLLNLSTQQGLVNESIAEGKIIEISAGAYAILLKVIEGEGIGMIEADLVQ